MKGGSGWKEGSGKEKGQNGKYVDWGRMVETWYKTAMEMELISLEVGSVRVKAKQPGRTEAQAAISWESTQKNLSY